MRIISTISGSFTCVQTWSSALRMCNMPTQIETANPTAVHARLETLSELLDTLADRFYRSYAVDWPSFQYLQTWKSEDPHRFEEI